MPFSPIGKYAHPDFSRPGVKPSGDVCLDLSGLGAYVSRAFVPQSGLADLIYGSLNATGSIYTKANTAVFAAATGEYLGYPDSQVPSDELSVIFRVRRGSTGTYTGICGDKDSANFATDDGFFINLRSDTSRIAWGVGSDQCKPQTSWSALDNTTDFFDVCCTYRKTGQLKIYVNGAEPSSYLVQQTPALWTQSSTDFRIGNYYTDAYPLAGVVEYLYVIKKELSKNQIIEFHRSPYQILKPAYDIQGFWSAGGGTNYPLTADVGALTLSGGTVTFTKDQSITLDVGALTLAGDAVTFTHNTGGVYELTADVGALTLGSDAATFSLGYNLTADVGALTIAGDAVTFSSGYNLTADVGALTLSGDSVAFSKTQGITLDVGALTLSGGTATFTVGVLASPDCTTFLESIIVEAYFLTSYIDDSGEFYQSVIDGGPFFLESDITGEDLFLEGGLC